MLGIHLALRHTNHGPLLPGRRGLGRVPPFGDRHRDWPAAGVGSLCADPHHPGLPGAGGSRERSGLGVGRDDPTLRGSRRTHGVSSRSDLVRSRGLEPPRLAAPTPQAGASTNSATTARHRRQPGPGSSHGPGPGARTSSKTGRREQASRRHRAAVGLAQQAGPNCHVEGCADDLAARAGPSAHDIGPVRARRMDRLARARALRGGVRVHGRARRCHRCRQGAGARLAARAPAALHGRHQRQAGRPARAGALSCAPHPVAAASSPTTGRASASAMSCSTLGAASATCAPT